MAMCSTAYAAQLGHARIVSAQGEPLRIAVPLTQLEPRDQQSVWVAAAPPPAWVQAGLTPPVDPATLRFRLADGMRPDTKIVQISSSQPFSGPVADLLLEVQTASGRRQYQVSILAPVTAGAPAAQAVMSASSGSGALGQTGALAGGSMQAIRVNRGDTLFSIARRHAVPGVSVYQMMVALQRANPQAFIHGNLNLIKAGASLGMPSTAELTAISDHEARRIFQRHVQEFNEYRQGLAGRPGQALAGGSAAQAGQIQAGPAPTGAAQAVLPPRDKVVLSGASPDNTADERAAIGKNLADSESRVSQLEQNVKNLNQALQGQGEAAKDAVLDGASELGKSISDAATTLSESALSLTGGTPQSEGASGQIPAPQATPSGAPAAPQVAGATAPSPSSTSPAGASSTASTGAAPAAGAANTAGAAQTPATAASAAGSATATSSAQAAGQGARPALDVTVGGGASPSSAGGESGPGGASAPASGAEAQNASNKAEQSVSWFQEHLLGVVTALLALIVLVIAWILRRANLARDDDDHGAPITEAMVKEQLEKINLDLSEPPTDELPGKR